MSLRKKKPISRHISMMALPTTSENGGDGSTQDLGQRVNKKPKRASWKKLSFAGFPLFNRHSPSSSSDGDGSAATSPTSPMSPGVRQELGMSPPPGYIYYGGALISRDPESRNFQGASKVVGKAMSLDRNTGRVGRNNFCRQSDMSLLDMSIDDEAVFSDSCPSTLSLRHNRIFSDPTDEALFNVMLRGESRRESRSESRGEVRRELVHTRRVDRERTMSDGHEESGWRMRRKTGLVCSQEQLQVCYHSDCQERNGHHAVMLCAQCDESVHTGTTGHLRFNIPQKVSAGKSLQRNMSICSLPSPIMYQSKSDTEDEDMRTRIGSADEDCTDAVCDVILNLKLRRKKALKGRRHHTEDALEMKGTPHALSLQPQHQRSQSLQDMDLSSSEKTWRVCDHRMLVNASNPVSDEAKHGYFDMLEEMDTVPSTTAMCRHYCNSVSSRDLRPPLTIHAKTNSMPVSMASTHVTAMNMVNSNGTSFCDSRNENISPMVSMSNSHSMCSIRESAWGDAETGQHALRTINDHHGNDLDSLVDLRKSLPPSMSMPLWLEQSADRRSRKISVPAKLMTPKREEAPRKYSLGTECFMLMFDLLPQSDVEIVAATKGVTLRGAITPPLERRGIPVSSIDVFLASSNTPLPLDVDSYPLGGNQLHVKAKEGSDPHAGRHSSMTAKSKTSTNQKDRDRKLSNARGKKSCPEDNMSITSETSPCNTMLGSEKVKMTKNASKFKDLFTPSFKMQKQEQLMEKLNQYSTVGFPAMPELLTMGEKVYLDEIFEIESDWKQIVNNPESLSKQKRDQQEAMWELLHTEVNFIKKVKVIIDLFMSCLINLQNEQLLNEIETEKIFSNISEIYQVNCAFWEQYLLPVLKHTRETRQQLDPSLLKEGFLQFETLFCPYKKYCLEQKNAIEYIRDKYMENDLFKAFIMWAESQKQCQRLTIRAMIVMPMQRLTKYKLLLKAILKKTDKDDSPKDLIQMIQRVDVFVAHVNTALHQKQEHERLSMIIDKIETYDIIDFPNDETMKLVSEYCHFDLTCPIPGCPQQRRNLLREGALKLKEKDSPRMDVYCFLFTDMLLITKLVTRKGDKVKVIKPPMRLDKVSIQQLRDGSSCVLVYLNEYHVASALYTLLGETRPWVDHITRAQVAYKQLRMAARDKSELHLMYMDSDDDSAIFNNIAFSDTTPGDSRSLVRQDSSCSVDMYMPSEGRHLADPLTSTQHRLISIGSDETEMYGENRLWYMGESMASSPHFSTDTQFHFDDALMSGKPSVKPKPCLKWGSASQLSKSEQTKSASSLSSDWTRPPVLPSMLDATFLTDENVHTKLNQRRNMRTEKRYYTADAIQDLQKDRDPSIHKRLSWNLGAFDMNIEERMANIKGKTHSSESVRSMPSSSGVSSTASLHASPDTDAAVEIGVSPTDNVVDIDQGVGSEDTDLVRLSKHFSESSMDHSAYTQQLIGQTKTASNSMPDISQLIAAGELQNGIASVELPHGQRRQMSHAQILRMTKQLLLNSTLEASQV